MWVCQFQESNAVGFGGGFCGDSMKQILHGGTELAKIAKEYA